MLGREMDHVLVFRVGQESTPFCAVAKFCWLERNAGQASDASAHVQVPVRVEIVHHPMETASIGKLLGHVAQVPAKIHAPPALADVAEDLPGRYYRGGDQAARAVTDV